jgi:hypothetical protein
MWSGLEERMPLIMRVSEHYGCSGNWAKEKAVL